MRSIDRAVVQHDRYGGERIVHRRGQLLKTTPHTQRGAVYVKVDLGTSKRTRMVHLLVLEAFAGPRPPGMVGCHGPTGWQDNRLVNLRWDTQSNNLLDQQRDGTNRARNKTVCPFEHRLTEPNLVAAKLRAGHRTCLACQRASAAAADARHRGLEVRPRREVADEKYEAIMRTAKQPSSP